MNSPAIPAYVAKYFWGDNLKELDLQKNHQYIIETLLNLGDREALKWLFSKVKKESIKELLPSLKLDKKSAHFWNLYIA